MDDLAHLCCPQMWAYTNSKVQISTQIFLSAISDSEIKILWGVLVSCWLWSMFFLNQYSNDRLNHISKETPFNMLFSSRKYPVHFFLLLLFNVNVRRQRKIRQIFVYAVLVLHVYCKTNIRWQEWGYSGGIQVEQIFFHTCKFQFIVWEGWSERNSIFRQCEPSGDFHCLRVHVGFF